MKVKKKSDILSKSNDFTKLVVNASQNISVLQRLPRAECVMWTFETLSLLNWVYIVFQVKSATSFHKFMHSWAHAA